MVGVPLVAAHKLLPCLFSLTNGLLCGIINTIGKRALHQISKLTGSFHEKDSRRNERWR